MTPEEYSALHFQADIRTLLDAGIPREEVARQLGVERSTVWRWEKGAGPKLALHSYAVHLWAARVRHDAAPLGEALRLPPKGMNKQHVVVVAAFPLEATFKQYSAVVDCLRQLLKGMTHQQLCAELRISRSTLYNWFDERDMSSRKARDVLALAAKNGIDGYIDEG